MDVLNSVNYVTTTGGMAYSTLTGPTYGQYLGKAIKAQYWVTSTGYPDPSDTYAISTDSNFIKQKPGLMTAGPTVTQTTA